MEWGLDSEHGVLRDVLLCRPDHYNWMPVNAVARHTLDTRQKLDLQAAQRQYGELEAALEEGDVRLHYLEPDPALRYQVYTRDSSQMTPYGVAVTQLFRPERRGEYAAVLKFYADKGIPIWRNCTAGPIEGGDIHIIRPGLMLIGYSGERTTQAGATQFARWFEEQGWEVRLEPFPEYFLHQDLTFSIVEDRLALATVDVLEDDLLAWLKAKRIELIPVNYKDTMRLGCNCLALGNGRVISAKHNVRANAAMRAHGLKVLDPEFSLFTMGGGGAHCMTMPLRRDPIGRA